MRSSRSDISRWKICKKCFARNFPDQEECKACGADLEDQ